MKDLTTYLTELAGELIISPTTKDRIDTSISYLKQKLWGCFQNKLYEVEVFGSYDRDTMIMQDEESDVDIMIVFKQKDLQPDTYLSNLKDFCLTNYSRSEIYQDHPTIVLDMDHVKFEIVPSHFVSESTRKIPAPKSKDLKWISTEPKTFKKNFDAKDANNKKLFKPVVRILKYWNSLNGHPFTSYGLEKILLNKSYSCTTLKDYFLYASSALIESAETDSQKKAVEKLKDRKRRLRVLEDHKIPEYLESELQAFLPLP